MKSIKFILPLLLIFLAQCQLWSQIELEKIIPGMSQAIYIEVPDIDGEFKDFNGDHIPDLAFFEASPGDDSLFIRIVLTGVDEEVWVTVANESGVFNSDSWVIIGFTELDGNPESKEIIMAEKRGRRRFINPVVLGVVNIADYTIWRCLWDGKGKALIGVTQMDGDDCKEIIVSDPAWPRVEIYGKKI